MSVGFHNFHSNDVCSICLDTMTDSDVVAHNGARGEQHPWHRACIKDWIRVQAICPCCRLPLKESSLFLWKERTITELNFINKDTYVGLKAGIISGAVLEVIIKSMGRDMIGLGSLIGIAGGVYIAIVIGETARKEIARGIAREEIIEPTVLEVVSVVLGTTIAELTLIQAVKFIAGRSLL